LNTLKGKLKAERFAAEDMHVSEPSEDADDDKSADDDLLVHETSKSAECVESRESDADDDLVDDEYADEAIN
jgi:hypothetical protein